MGLRDRYLYHYEHIFFITTTCNKWLSLLTIGSCFEIITESMEFCCKKYDANILGYALMPNHIHLILHFQDGIKRIAFMRDFKKFTSVKIRQEIEVHSPEMIVNIRHNRKGQVFKVW